MEITHAKTKTEAITIALNTVIEQAKVRKLIQFHGSVDMDINLDELRKR